MVKEVEHIFFIFYLLFCCFLGLILFLLSLTLSFSSPDFEKISPYECGFQPFQNSRFPFNVKYFKVALLFVVFDLEVIFLLPWVSNIQELGLWGNSYVMFFLSFLILGYFVEWCQGIFEWV